MDTVFDDLNLDINEADNENKFMENNGQPATVEYWQNHEVHLYQHNRRRKTEEWKQLDPMIKMAYEQHIQTHIMVLMQGPAHVPMSPIGPKPVDQNVTDTLQQNPIPQPGMGGGMPLQASMAMQRLSPMMTGQQPDDGGRQTITVNNS
jgi:hypothetical protein